MTVTFEVTVTSPPATNTLEPTPTLEPLLPPEVKEKFDKAGIDLKDMSNAKLDMQGLHITLEDGTVVDVKTEYLEKVICNGQNNVLQIREKEDTKVKFAFDPETKTFLEASKYVQMDASDPEKYIQVKDWDELKTIWAKEKMFLTSFNPDKTYFPPLDKIYTAYDTPNIRGNNWRIFPDPHKEFRSAAPFGKLPHGMESPFRFVNFIKIQNITDKRDYPDAYIVSEQVYNSSDGTFSVIHFYLTNPEILQERIAGESIFLPWLFLTEAVRGSPSADALIQYYRDQGLLERDGKIPIIVNLVTKWLTDGKVPPDLEIIPSFALPVSIR